MILDIKSAFCFDATINNATANYSTDFTTAGTSMTGYIDLGATDAFAASTNTGTEYYGVGGDTNGLLLEALVTTAFTDAGSDSTVTVSLETADDSSFSSNLTNILTLGTFAALTAAKTKLVGLLPIGPAYRRYIRVKFTMANGALSTGKISAFIAQDAQLNYTYPQRSSIIAG